MSSQETHTPYADPPAQISINLNKVCPSSSLTSVSVCAQTVTSFDLTDILYLHRPCISVFPSFNSSIC